MNDIELALNELPVPLLSRSGAVFYSGQSAFSGKRPLYLLGLNPGGDPFRQASNTVGSHILNYRMQQADWSEYADASWRGAEPGKWGLQPRVLHMLNSLGMDPRLTPASNVVFVRTPREKALKSEKASLLEQCWPVHQAVIEELGVRVVACFGGTAGRWVREMIGAHEFMDSFIESNARHWKSQWHIAPDGRSVVTLTHPSVADWRNPKSDPVALVRRALDYTTGNN